MFELFGMCWLSCHCRGMRMLDDDVCWGWVTHLLTDTSRVHTAKEVMKGKGPEDVYVTQCHGWQSHPSRYFWFSYFSLIVRMGHIFFPSFSCIIAASPVLIHMFRLYCGLTMRKIGMMALLGMTLGAMIESKMGFQWHTTPTPMHHPNKDDHPKVAFLSLHTLSIWRKHQQLWDLSESIGKSLAGKMASTEEIVCMCVCVSEGMGGQWVSMQRLTKGGSCYFALCCHFSWGFFDFLILIAFPPNLQWIWWCHFLFHVYILPAFWPSIAQSLVLWACEA